MATDKAADAARLRRELAIRPHDRVTWHNLAAVEGDLGNSVEAEAAARRAIALGIPAPETRVVLARALQDLNRLDEAERSFEEALRMRPAYPDAHRDYAQLRWMRTGRSEAALAALDDALRRAPQEILLYLVRSIALEFMGDPGGALASVEAGLAREPAAWPLARQASHLCAELGDGARAVAFAQRAAAADPKNTGLLVTLCEAFLAAGDVARAEGVAADLRSIDPMDQHAIALQATAWRLLGDPRYAPLYDYGQLTHSEAIDAPLERVRSELESLHRYRTHPFQQSVRGGGQLPLNARELERPALRALFQLFAGTVERYLARLGPGADPFRARNSGRSALAGAWSVRLSSGGSHTDHVHPRGWLSSAFYVAVPPVMKPESTHAGWLRLGRPGITTKPALAPECRVKPEPGKLVLFPSYMWHGVEQFESDDVRITVAFDALPG